jgi:hypothetical protein
VAPLGLVIARLPDIVAIVVPAGGETIHVVGHVDFPVRGFVDRGRELVGDVVIVFRPRLQGGIAEIYELAMRAFVQILVDAGEAVRAGYARVTGDQGHAADVFVEGALVQGCFRQGFFEAVEILGCALVVTFGSGVFDQVRIVFGLGEFDSLGNDLTLQGRCVLGVRDGYAVSGLGIDGV